MTTDPTPRTAATAREALEAICAAHYNDPDGGMGYTSAGYGTFETACVVCGTSDEYAVEWPCWTWTTANAGLIALAAAEAPGRVAALEAALERIAHEPCWDEPVSCLSRFRALAAEALAAPAPTPSEPVEVGLCDFPGCRGALSHARPGDKHEPNRDCHPFQRATPTPSEPVERCVRGVYAVHAGIPTVVSCGEPHDAEAHEQGAPDYDHPFTPATRDE